MAYEQLKAFLATKGLTVNETKQATKIAIEDYLKQAILDDKTYLAIAAPSTTDKNNQIVRLTRQNVRIMRLLLNDLTSAE